jgi:hypothetical protein
MKLKMKRFGSQRAALSLALLAGTGLALSGMAFADVAALAGGDQNSGDQATLVLDSSVPEAFTLTKPGSGGPVATAWFGAHLFCVELAGISNQLVLAPRWQQPVEVGDDVWQFPQVSVPNLTYQGSGFQNAGAPSLRIGVAANAALTRFRCLTAHARSSLEPWDVSHGGFDSGYGDYFGPDHAAANTPPPQVAPSAAHQNVKVVAEQFGGFAGKSVSVVRVEMQFDGVLPASTEWTLVDAINTSALSSRTDATWCLLRADWVEGTTPPSQLCNDAAILMPGFGPESGRFVNRALGFSVVTPGPYYVLVERTLAEETPTAGTAIQGFAALRTAGGMVGVADELQDWYPNDSVWYNF